MTNHRFLLIAGPALIALLIMIAAGVVIATGPSLPGLVPLAQNTAGAAFTYQGHLSAEGTPANGSFDFQFRLFDDATESSPIGLPVTLDGVTVSDGLFSVALDFGSGAFDGGARWLEIGVRRSGEGGEYTILDPRQPITPTPYAIRSLVDADTLGSLSCQHNQVAKWNDIAQEWQCAGVSDEVDENQEFTANGTFIVPDGITRLQVEVWGAGGGGGDHGSGSLAGGGGGGGGGGYSQARVDVTPGETLTINIGQGGDPGMAGEPTSVMRGGVELVAATGGLPGQDGQDGNCGTNTPGAGGTGGSGGLGDTQEGNPGGNGGAGSKGGFPITQCFQGVGGEGGPAIQGSVIPQGGSGGRGGGALGAPNFQLPPVPGGNGYVLIRW